MANYLITKIIYTYNLLLKPLKENCTFFIFLYATGIFSTLLPGIILNTKLLRISFFTWFFDIYILCAFLVVFKLKIRKILRSVIAVIFYLLSIIDTFCIITHNTNFNSEILNLILDTNEREASEYIHQYLGTQILISPIVFILFIAILHLILSKRKDLAALFSSDTAYSRVSKAIINCFILVSTTLSLPYRIDFIQILLSKSIFEIDEHVSYQALNTPFKNLLFGIKLRIIEREELGELADNQQKAAIISCSFETPEIVFIIGESYIKSHSQLYGYEKETTPLQKSRTVSSCNGLLIPYTDVVTPSNYTSTVFKNIFSMKSIDDKRSWKSFSLFPILFKKAGYHVNFITSQFVKNTNRDIFNLTGGLFLNNPTISSLAFDCRNDKAPRYDETLLEYYDSIKVHDKEHNLTIFHLAGQHIDFYKRSPKKWKRFNINHYQDRQDISEKEKKIISDYDNATLYNDYVVNEIIKKFETKEAIVIYMPDHGEGCYDGGHKLGRMPKGEYTKNILENEYNIPFWIWYSKLYEERHPLICRQIKDSRNRPFMTDDIPHLLLYLGGIKCDEYQVKKNLISPYYDTHRKRLLYGNTDYDSIMVGL